jgi:antitoxin ParD1/3/4
MSSLQVDIPDALATFLHEQVAAGHYASANELICDALRRLAANAALLGQLRQDIAEGLASGPAKPFNVDDFLRRVHRTHDTSSGS